MNAIHEETWAVLELHFLTRPHLMDRARAELVDCLDGLLAAGQPEAMLKDRACRTIQLKFGPAPAACE